MERQKDVKMETMQARPQQENIFKIAFLSILTHPI